MPDLGPDDPTMILGATDSASKAGAMDYWLEVPQEPNGKLVFPLHDGDNRIGQRLDCDIPVLDPFASRNHCVIHMSPKAIRLIDLGSTNGTVVNGRPIHDVPLVADDVIQAGNTQLHLKSAPRGGEGHPHWRGQLLAETIRKTVAVPLNNHDTCLAQ